MTNLFLLFLSGSISVGLVTVVLFALTPFLNKRYAAKWKYWIWLFLAVRLLLPISGADVRTARQTQLGTKTQLTVQTAQDNNTTAVSADTPRVERMTVEIPAQMIIPITGHTQNGGMQITLLSVVVMLWAAGALGFLSVHLLSYMRYKRQFIKMGTIIEDSRFWHQLQELKQELGIKRSVLPVASADAASPMMLGFFHAVIVLPDEDYSAEELYFILKHELIHLRRGDVYLKLLLVTANAIHWFNPLIWLMRKEAVVDMELSCDEYVTQDVDYTGRKAYTETLLSTLHRQCAKQIALSTQFYGGKQVMKKRFQNILRKTRKKNGAGILMIAIFCTVGLGTLIGCSVADESVSGVQKLSGTEKGQSDDMLAETVLPEQEGSDTDIQDIVLEEAQAWTTEEYEYHKRVSVGNHYSGWRIESLAHCYTYEDYKGMVLQVYRMNILFLSDMPESVFLVGGMSMTEDGWVVPDYPNSRYLVFQQDGDTLTLLARMFENDCEAGDDTFTHDLEHQLALGQQPQPTLTYSLEGEAYEVPAVVVQGNGYTFYLPDGKWYPSDFENWENMDEEWKSHIFDAWTAWNNEDVRLWTVRLEGMSLGEAQKELQDKGYAVIGDRMFRQDGDMIYGVELKETETDTWGVFSCYPVDAQEGWGVQIHAIADTFTASETGNF